MPDTAAIAWLGTSFAANLPLWVTVIVAIVGQGALWRFRFRKVEGRLKSAEAAKTEAETDSINAKTARELVLDMKDRLTEHEREVSRLRDETRESNSIAAQAVARETTARAEVAVLKADIARMEAEWGRERHDMKEQIALLKATGELRERKVSELEQQVNVLRAKAGDLERRHTT